MERNDYRTDYEDDFTGHYKFAADGETIVPDEGTATVIRPGYSVNKPWFEYNEEAGYYMRVSSTERPRSTRTPTISWLSPTSFSRYASGRTMTITAI